jgi:N-acetylneuraminate synthase
VNPSLAPLVRISGRAVGAGHSPYLVAELSANHHHRLDHAIATIRAAKLAGADAIKLQTYTPDTMTIDSEAECFALPSDSTWAGRRLYELYQEAYTPWEWHGELKRVANELGLDLFSTPFDESAVDFLESLGVPAYKIASFEVVDLPLLRRIAATGKPIIMSTGMASLAEIDEAVRTLRDAGAAEIVLLKCTSAYPAPPEEMNLVTIPHLAAAFGVPVGLSDHTLGSSVAIASVALGACVVEKHFTLSRADKGPDSAFSMEPDEFRDMAASVRVVEAALGRVNYAVTAHEESNARLRRSLFVVADVKAGEPFTASNVRSIRPGHGLPPRHLPQVLGRFATRDIRRGTPLSWDLLGG